jgi:D-alanyl-D-alanine carboxypeptidase/D-alanyl-D-alanine-endopeptidase (penicillin-binding protein 4)
VPSTASVQSSAAWPAELDSALSAQALGPDVAGLVTDAGTGRVLYSRFSNRPQQPASTIKILTAITVLKAFGPDARLTTQVQFGATNRDIILRGGGDATLARVNSPEAGWPAGQGARPATLTDLASRTALSLHKAGISAVRLQFDDSLFVGTRLAPGWKPSFVAAGVVSPVTALSVDGGRVSAGSASRSLDPAQSAAEFFAARLRKLGISVASDVKRTDGSDTAAGAAGDLSPSPATSSVAGSKVLATVVSPPMADLVERLLTRSDDDLAEALGHLAGGKLAGSASFQGGVTATMDTLEQLGMSLRGTKLADASGLSSLNELDPETFTQALAAVVADKPFTGSNVGVLWPVSSGLPVAGVTGTLSDRFTTAKTSAGRGIVRAKTGTLTGVVGLAGIVLDAHGHLLIFDFDADRSPGPLEAARAAVDRAATLVASH